MDARSVFLTLFLPVLLHMTSGQDSRELDNCDVTKQCLIPTKYRCPECKAYVTWQTMVDGQTRFAMSATLNGIAWVALGLKKHDVKDKMSPADVYSCTNVTEVLRSKNVLKPYDSVRMDMPNNNAVTPEFITREDNSITCAFTRQPSAANDDTFYDISGDNRYFILLAAGDEVNADGSIETHAHILHSRWLTREAVKVQADFIQPDLNGCGKTKGCFKSSESCNGPKVDTAYVTWQLLKDGQYRFAMQAKADGWVAFGLKRSDVDDGMSPAEVYACTSQSRVIRLSENVKYPYDSKSLRIPKNTVTTQSAVIRDGVISCVFTRKASLDGDKTFYNISGDHRYYILLAIGNEINDDGTIEGNVHENYWASCEPWKLSDYTPTTENSAEVLPKAHGSFENSTDVHHSQSSTRAPVKAQVYFYVQPDSRELDDCNVTKGCLVPTKYRCPECKAYVTWQTMVDGQTRFVMSATLNDIAWVAVGLKPSYEEDEMSPADVYSCTNVTEVLRSKNVLKPYDSVRKDMPDNNAVTPEFITRENNTITCAFTRQPRVANDDTFYDTSGDDRYYVLLAVGNKVNADGSIEGHAHVHHLRWSTRKAVKMNGCGDLKGCFKSSKCCNGNDCTAFMTWQLLKDGQFRFTMRAKADGWVAFGLRRSSIDDGMSPAEVYACTNQLKVERSENVGYDSEPTMIPNNTITNASVVFEDGVISCVFTQQPSLDGDDTFYNISGDNRYYILLAIGNEINDDGTIEGNKHERYWVSPEARALSNYSSLTRESGADDLPKAHAAVMVIAWIGFASIGITMARYFKPMWSSSTLLGQKVWFQIHRVSLVICTLCFIIGLVLIVFRRGGYVEVEETQAFAHGILGIIAICLGAINPIMAFFRPHPGSLRRPIFNWAHWVVGYLAYLIAVVSIFLGNGYHSSLLTGSPDYVSFIAMAIFTVFQILVWILFEVQRRLTESQGRSADVQLETTDELAEQLITEDDSPMDDLTPASACSSQVTKEGSRIKTILLGVYALGVIITVLALVIRIILLQVGC